MPQKATEPQCLCLARQKTPATIFAQRKFGPVTAVDADLETLALLGTQLAGSVITTSNPAALISGKGGYAPYQSTSTPFRLSRNRINIRVAPQAAVDLYCSRDVPDRTNLIVADKAGNIVHRVTVRDGIDAHVIEALETIPDEDVSMPGAVTRHAASRNVVSLSAVRAARDNWDCGDTGQHLNDVMIDCGLSRAQILPYVGRCRAWPVVTQTVASFVIYLCDKSIRHARLIPGTGLIQSDLSRGGKVSQVGSILRVQNAHQNLALDLEQVRAVWVTRFGAMSQLELYNADGRAIAILAADPASDISEWNTLLASLPSMCRPHGSIQDAH